MKNNIQKLNRNLTAAISSQRKFKGSPSNKENNSFMESKYLSLLKSKRDSTKKSFKNDQKQKRLSKLLSNKSKKDLNRSSTNNWRDSLINAKMNKPSTNKLGFFTSTNKQKTSLFKKSDIDNLIYNSKVIKKSFRSPPANSKNTMQAKLINSYNSQGKIRYQSNEHKNDRRLRLRESRQDNENCPEFSLYSPGNEYKRTAVQKEQADDSFLQISENMMVKKKCVNHPKKKSKFYSKESEFIDDSSDIPIFFGFCSKCAVSLVKEGYNCEEIMLNNEMIRQSKIRKFLEELTQGKSKCKETITVLEKKKTSLEFNMKTENEQVDSYFSKIFAFLSAQKFKIKERLKLGFGNSTSALDQLIREAKEYNYEFKTIGIDIEENYTNIIKKIELEPFKEILCKYKERLGEFDKIKDNLQNLKLTEESVHFQKRFEDIEKNFDVNCKIRTANSTIFQTTQEQKRSSHNLYQHENDEVGQAPTFSDIEYDDSEEESSNNMKEESFRKNNTRSDLYISFDKDYLKETNQISRLSNVDVNKNYETEFATNQSTQKYINILEKMDKPGEKQEKSNEESQTSSENISEHKVFEIDREGIDDWQLKQTPDLGVKDEPPDYIKNHFEVLHNNAKNSEIIKNLEKNSIGGFKKDKETTFKSQKVLFR